jgi:hypothetical protein
MVKPGVFYGKSRRLAALSAPAPVIHAPWLAAKARIRY